MATQTFETALAQRDPAQLLRRALQIDAFASVFSGAGLLLAAGPISRWLGLGLSWPLALIGADMIIFGVWVGFEAQREQLRAGRVRAVLALNAAWLIASALLIAFDPFGLSVAGKWAVAGVADLVLLIAIGEYLGLRRLARASLI